MNRLSDIKRAQKESQFFRVLSSFFLKVTGEEPRLRSMTLSRVKLSPDKGSCSLYFYTPEGPEKFSELLPILILFKGSLRKAVSQEIPGRYTPELFFKFDETFEKQQRIETLLEKVKVEAFPEEIPDQDSEEES